MRNPSEASASASVSAGFSEPSIATPSIRSSASRLLDRSGMLWFVVAVMGQWIFAAYIFAYYAGSLLQGKPEKWGEQLEHGFVSGDWLGNVMIFMHIFLAFVITLGGPLQIVPALRKRYPRFHRVNGRVYLLTAVLISLAGIYIILFRGIVGSLVIAMGNFINAALILTSAYFAWRFAVRRNMKIHRKWALRLYVLASGVWFFRLGFATWILIHQGAPGHTDAFDGPLDIALSYGHTLLPLLVLEIYFWAQEKAGKRGKTIMAVSLGTITLLMAAGIFAATMVFWLPRFS